MKKSLLAVLAAVFMTVPVFAADSSDVKMDITAKLGYLFSPEVTLDTNGNPSASKDSSISLGAEMYFWVHDNLAVGAGIMWSDMHKFSSDIDAKVGFSNIYAAIKPRFAIKDVDGLYVYAIGQIGAAVADYELKSDYGDPSVEAGLYWGLGAGAEYKNFILEFIYGCNYGTFKNMDTKNLDFSYTAFRINVGYKFALN